MARKVPRKEIGLTIFTRDDSVLRVNLASPTEFPYEVSLACRMSTTPSRNGGQVVITNLGERTRNRIAGVISQRIDYTNASLAPGSDGFIPLPGGRIATGASVVPGGFAKTETINNGDGYIEVDAGENFEIGRVFEGSVKYARHVHDRTHWFTTIDIWDGGSTLTGGHANDRFPAGTPLVVVLKHLVRAMGLDIGNLSQATLDEVLGNNSPSIMPNGYIAMGSPKHMVTKLLTSTGAEWFIDRGTFWIVKQGQTIPGASVDLDIQSGLSGVPQPLPGGGVGFNSRFRKDIRIGREVILRSSQLSGSYRCDVIEHRLNNYQGEWMSTGILRRGETIPGVF